MSLNKHAAIRYRAIDECLSNNLRTWDIQQIEDAVNDAIYEYDGSEGIERRQLRSDIAFMKDSKGYSAPIEHYRDGKKHLYRYSEKGFSISNKGINSGEAEIMGEAVRFLSSFRGRPGFEMLDEIIPVLEDKLGVSDLGINFISYGDNTYYSGYDFIGVLFKAIKDNIVLDVVYKPYKDEPFAVKFHPHHLKNFNNRYFVFGLNQDNGIQTWNMALDRIQKISPSKEDFIKSDIDWTEYFSDIVGVTRRGNDVEEIKLRINLDRLPYVLTKPLHESQKVKSEDPDGIVYLTVEVNRELKQLLYGFGGDIEVIKPEWLKEEMKKEAKRMFDNYCA